MILIGIILFIANLAYAIYNVKKRPYLCIFNAFISGALLVSLLRVI